MSEAIARELSAARRRLEALETLERGRFAARVYNSRTSPPSLVSGFPSVIPFDTEEYDYGGLHSTSTNTTRLTAPIGGIYVITGHIAFTSNATGYRQISIRKNAGSYPWYSAVAGGIAAYDAIAATSYANSKVNLLNSGTYDAGNGVAFPAWAQGTGWTFTAALSQYLTTGITPAAFNQDYSMFVSYTVNDVVNQRPLLSAGNVGTSRLLDVWAADWPSAGRFYGSGSQSANVGTGLDTSGWMGLSGRETWYNGATDGTLGAGTSAATGQDIRIGQYVPSGWYHDGTILRIWIADSIISNANVPVLYRAMTDLAYPAIAHQATTAVSGSETRMSISTVEYMAAGDYVELLAYQNSGAALSIDYEEDHSPYFTMSMI